MAYTYDEFNRAAQDSGLYFSEYDLALAQKNPDVGMGILAAKQKWQAATTDAERQQANLEAEQLRAANGSYYGGADGSEYNPFGTQTVQTSFAQPTAPSISYPEFQMPQTQSYQAPASFQTPSGSFQPSTAAPTYQSPYDGEIAQLYQQQKQTPEFQYDVPQPTYQNQYADQMADLYQQQQNYTPFQYDKAAPTFQDTQAGEIADLYQQQKNYAPFQSSATQPTYQDQYGGEIANALESLRNTPAYQAPEKPAAYENGYADQIADLYRQQREYGPYESNVARPEYQNRYDDQIQGMLQNLVNRPGFNYDPNTDPLYSAYRKQYIREGQRATQDALGAASAASAGMPSSYAVTAATQTGDRYSAALTDKIPELYQAAYDRWLREFSVDQSKLSALQNAEATDYNRYRDALSQYNTDRNFDYGVYQDQYDRLRNDLATARDLEQTDYGRYLDQLSQYNTDRNFNYGVYQDDYARRQNELGLLRQLQQDDYGRYLDALGQYNTNRNFEYGAYQDQYGRLLDTQAAARQMQQDEYGRYLDALGQYNTDRNLAYTVDRDQYNRILDAQNTTRQMEQDEYARYLDQLGQYNNDRNFAFNVEREQYNRLQDAQDRARQMEQDQYARYLDQLQQYNTDRDYNFDVYRDNRDFEFDRYRDERDFNYDVYRDDRDFNYNAAMDQYGMQQDAYNAQVAAENNAYKREMDEREYQAGLSDDEWNRQYKLAQLAAASGDLSYLESLGIDTSNYYTVNPIKGSSSGGGGGRSSGGGSGSGGSGSGGSGDLTGFEYMKSLGTDRSAYLSALSYAAQYAKNQRTYDALVAQYEEWFNALPDSTQNASGKRTISWTATDTARSDAASRIDNLTNTKKNLTQQAEDRIGDIKAALGGNSNRVAGSADSASAGNVAYYTQIISDQYANATDAQKQNKIKDMVKNGLIDADEGAEIYGNVTRRKG